VTRLGPPAAECRVFTGREGLLGSLGHDLELEVTRFDVQVDEVARRVDASFDAASLRVARASRDGKDTELSSSDRRSIEDNVRRYVLQVARHPEIRYRSTGVTDVADGFDVKGGLTLCGREREVLVPLRKTGARWAAEVRLDQRDFGIEPYTAFMGALRVKAELVVRLSFPAT